jgi:Tol biopolymer transport system component
MVWLRSGNIAAYLTSTGDAYLVDLSGSAPGTSQLAVTGPASPGALTPSPNGKSLIVGTFKNDPGNPYSVVTLAYVTWTAGAPTTVIIAKDIISEQLLHLSYDGRLGVMTTFGGSAWWDLSAASPKAATLSDDNHSSFAWSPNRQALIFDTSITADLPLSLGTFDAGGLTSTGLVSGCYASGGSWSPDGKNVVFRCKTDVRGISNVAPAAVGSDFALLPSGFLSNAFTDTSFGWSPDSKWIALSADRDVNGQFDLYLIRWSAPGTTYKPHANSIAPGVTTWAFSQNSQSVAFVGTIAPQNNAALYLTKLPASGAPPTATLISAPASSVVQTDINWLPGSRVIAYRATVSGAQQLFAVPVTADGTAGSPIPISGASGAGVSSYQLAPTR